MWSLSPSYPGPSSYRLAPILASSGRQKMRQRESVSSTSQGSSANRFWRFIRCTSVALAVTAGQSVRRQAPALATESEPLVRRRIHAAILEDRPEAAGGGRR